MTLDLLRDNQGSIKIAHFRKMSFSPFQLRILRIRRIARTHCLCKQHIQTVDHNDHIRHKVDPDHPHPELDNLSQTQMIGEITFLDLDQEKRICKINFLRSSHKPSQVTPAQRSQSSQMQNLQSRPFYNSGMERLRSQNSLFNSGDSRNFRERENSRDRNYNSRQSQRERGFSPGRSIYRSSSQDRENSYRYDPNYCSNYDRNRSASRERDQRQLRFRSPSPMYANRQQYNSVQ
jgi:hypothetical protein